MPGASLWALGVVRPRVHVRIAQCSCAHYSVSASPSQAPVASSSPTASTSRRPTQQHPVPLPSPPKPIPRSSASAPASFPAPSHSQSAVRPAASAPFDLTSEDPPILQPPSTAHKPYRRRSRPPHPNCIRKPKRDIKLSEQQLEEIPLDRLFKGALATRFRPSRAQLALLSTNAQITSIEQLYQLYDRLPDGGVQGAASIPPDVLLRELNQRGILEREFVAWCQGLAVETFDQLWSTLSSAGVVVWPTFLLKKAIELTRYPAQAARVQPALECALGSGSGSVLGSAHLLRQATQAWLEKNHWIQFAPWITSMATRLSRLTLMQRDHMPISLTPSDPDRIVRLRVHEDEEDDDPLAALALFGHAVIPAGNVLRRLAQATHAPSKPRQALPHPVSLPDRAFTDVAQSEPPRAPQKFSGSHASQPSKYFSRKDRETWQWYWQPVMQSRQALTRLRETLEHLTHEATPKEARTLSSALSHLDSFTAQHAALQRLDPQDLANRTAELARVLQHSGVPVPDLRDAADRVARRMMPDGSIAPYRDGHPVADDILFAIQSYLFDTGIEDEQLVQDVVLRAMELVSGLGAREAVLNLWIMLVDEAGVAPTRHADLLALPVVELIRMGDWEHASTLLRTWLAPARPELSEDKHDKVQGTSSLLRMTLEALLAQGQWSDVFLWFDEAVVRYAIRPDTTCLDLVLRTSCKASFPFPVPRSADYVQEQIESRWSLKRDAHAVARSLAPWFRGADPTLLAGRPAWHTRPPVAVAAQMFRVALLGQAPALEHVVHPLEQKPAGWFARTAHKSHRVHRWFKSTVVDALLPLETWDSHGLETELRANDVLASLLSEQHDASIPPDERRKLEREARMQFDRYADEPDDNAVARAYWARWRALGAGQAMYFDARLCEGYALAVHQLNICAIYLLKGGQELGQLEMEQLPAPVPGGVEDEVVNLVGWMKELGIRPTRLTLALALLDARRSGPEGPGRLAKWMRSWLGDGVVPNDEEVDYVRLVWYHQCRSARRRPRNDTRPWDI